MVAIGTTALFERLDVATTRSPAAGRLEPLGLVVLAERLRPETRETVEFFLEEGVSLKVISGDAPETVAAIAADAGIPSDGPPLDGRELPETRVSSDGCCRPRASSAGFRPKGSSASIEALRDGGQYVAMVGDGVNDVPALKAAQLAIAQGTGSQMAKSVADVVLVRGEFGVVPEMVSEGRKVLRNLQRVSKLFVTKSAFAVVPDPHRRPDCRRAIRSCRGI